MKSKPGAQDSPGGLSSKGEKKDSKKTAKQTAGQRSSIKRLPVSSRTQKCIAERTRDKSPKIATKDKASKVASKEVKREKSCKLVKNMAASSSDKKIPTFVQSQNTPSVSKSNSVGKQKSLAQQKSADVLKSVKKIARGKEERVKKAKLALKEKKSKGLKDKKARERKEKKAKEQEKKSKIAKKVPNHFIDFWSLATFGKREASLNASVKVNIMYEKLSPVKTSSKSPAKSPPKKEEDSIHLGSSKSMGATSSSQKKIPAKGKTLETSPKKLSPKGKTGAKDKSAKASKSAPTKNGPKAKQADIKSRKRKSPGYKIFKEEPSAKCRKVEKSGSRVKDKVLPKKKKKQSVPVGHQLSEIIERSPRQASLVAKAVIALDQEEETAQELAARTTIYDWMELRPFSQSNSRTIRWIVGLGNSSNSKEKEKEIGASEEQKDLNTTSTEDVDVCCDSVDQTQDNDSLHSTLLRTLHQIGDSRLLKEYFRAQKEDFHGSVDVEKCISPEKHKIASPDLKKQVSPPPCHEKGWSMDEKPQRVLDKPESCSPAKPQPCRVATPIPQFPVGQRTSHMTSYIHHPIPQPVYAQQHPHSHPQPIKVTPYTPSQAYIYQYTMDRPQTGIYVSPSPSPMPFGVGSSDISTRDFSPSFTFNHMGSLSLGRRGVNPYQPSNYSSPSLHMPVQQVGYNFQGYYPASMQTLPQQNIASLQSLPLHQQYPLVQPTVISPSLPQDVAQLGTYQHPYQQYQQMSAMNQDMPPPPPPPAHSHRSAPMGLPSGSVRPAPVHHQPMTPLSPIDSLKSMNPVGIQSIVKSPVLEFSATAKHRQVTNLHTTEEGQSLSPHRSTVSQYCPSKAPHLIKDYSQIMKGTSDSPTKYSVTWNRHHDSTSSSSPCKKECEERPLQSCDAVTQQNLACHSDQTKSSSVSRVACENSDVSDLLHSAHTAMYQIESVTTVENGRELHQTQASVSTSASSNTMRQTSFNASYSVSSILDMPRCKVKSEPEVKNCPVAAQNVLSHHQNKAGRVTGSEGNNLPFSTPDKSLNLVQKTPQKDLLGKETEQQTGPVSCTVEQVKDMTTETKSKENCNIIVIEDTDESFSSDDEPLAKLVKLKSSDDVEVRHNENSAAAYQKKSDSSTESKPKKVKKSSVKLLKPKGIKINHKSQGKPTLPNVAHASDSDVLMKSKKSTSTKVNPSLPCIALKQQHDSTKGKIPGCGKDQAVKAQLNNKESRGKGTSKKTTAGNIKAKKVEKKVEPINPLITPKVSASHGWTWVGQGQMKPVPKITLAEPVRLRNCYQSMRHSSGEVVSLRDSVILQSDSDGTVPYVAKVSALWESLSGDMMFSMLWFYQPEHTATGREAEDGEQELFASKHREENSVACIDDKCYVLMYNEYCRLEAEAVRCEQGVSLPRWRAKMPGVSQEDEKLRRTQPPLDACVDNIWFCRYDYDFRKKIVRKPKHKKSNLRYRVPNKVV